MSSLSFWEAFAINTFAVVLRAIMKNPARYQGVANMLREIAADITTAFPPEPAPPAVG